MNRKDLVDLLELVSPALSETRLVPVFTCFMFCDGAVSASSDALTIVAKSKIVEVDGLVFAVNGSNLLGLLRNSSVEEVSFSAGANEVEIKAGRSSFKLPFMTEEEFLFEEPKKEKWGASIQLNEDILRSLSICLTTVSSDHTAPAIMGVCFNFDNAAMFSCDGDAITRCKLSDAPGAGVYTVPTAFCNALLKICSETETTAGKLELSQGWARATLKNGFTIYGRLIENDSPLDHASLIKKTMTGKFPFVPIPGGFSEALGRARVLADQETATTVITVDGNKLKLLTETKMGTVNDELNVKGHEAVEAEVHASLVQRSLNICDQVSIRENCSCYKLGDTVLQVVSNIGE